MEKVTQYTCVLKGGVLMSKCDWCGEEMTDRSITSCSGNDKINFPDGTSYPSIPYDLKSEHIELKIKLEFISDEWYENHRCHDCGIGKGGKHHPGCDMEKCPKCGGQLISCGCLGEEDYFYSEEDDEEDF